MNDDWKTDSKFHQRLAEVQLRGAQEHFDKYLFGVRVQSISESPIEELMLNALMLVQMPLYFRERLPSLSEPLLNQRTPDTISSYEAMAEHSDEFALLIQQAKIGKYRVDFLIFAKFDGRGPYKFVIECDGHEFHEKTKEQAKRDRARDRALTMLGCIVFRFTGSDIWADALGCAHEVRRLIQKVEYEGRPD